MKIIEAFPFFNEINMLTYRLAVMNDVVDLFVIVEAPITHSGKDKPLYFKENEHLFEKYKHKIVHYVVEDMPRRGPNLEKRMIWFNEWHQRNSMWRIFDKLNLDEDDIIVVADLDEIVDPNLYSEIRKGNLLIDRVYKINQDMYYYNLNSRHTSEWSFAFIGSVSALRRYQNDGVRFTQLRNDDRLPIIWNAGWHLSFFGDSDFIKNKIEAYAHQEHNTPENKEWGVILARIRNVKEPFIRGSEYANLHLFRVDIKDNKYLPPQYETYLRKFYSKVLLIINSCLKFYPKTLPLIVETAKKAGIPFQDMYIVVGECDEERIDTTNEYTVIFTRFANEGNNGLVYFTKTEHGFSILKKYTHFFYTADTVVFLEDFWDNVNRFAATTPMYTKAEATASKGIGLINVDWFIENRKDLFSYIANTDKSLVKNFKIGKFPNEEKIRSLFPNLPINLNEDIQFLTFNGRQPVGNVFCIDGTVSRYMANPYGTNPRLANLYPDLGLIRYQSNHDVTRDEDWNLDI